jgi:DNA-binding transcriptional MerR regulator
MRQNDRAPELLAFTADHVACLTGLSHRQLRYWSDTDFFAPRRFLIGRGRPAGLIYSFRDVVALRTIAILRNEHRVPLQELRRVGEWLSKFHQTPWSGLRFYVAGKNAFFEDPQTGKPFSTRPLGQGALSVDLQGAVPVDLEQIARELQIAAWRLRDRQPEQIGKFERHRQVVQNAQVIAGTRVPTAAIWNLHRAGFEDNAIIREYPRLKPEDIKAAIEYEYARRKKRAG